MQDQKVIQVGNSLAVTLPSSFVKTTNIKAGTPVTVVADEGAQMVKITTKKKPQKQAVSPEFKKWLDTFIKDHRDILEELAKR